MEGFDLGLDRIRPGRDPGQRDLGDHGALCWPPRTVVCRHGPGAHRPCAPPGRGPATRGGRNPLHARPHARGPQPCSRDRGGRGCPFCCARRTSLRPATRRLTEMLALDPMQPGVGGPRSGGEQPGRAPPCCAPGTGTARRRAGTAIQRLPAGKPPGGALETVTGGRRLVDSRRASSAADLLTGFHPSGCCVARRGECPCRTMQRPEPTFRNPDRCRDRLRRAIGNTWRNDRRLSRPVPSAKHAGHAARNHRITITFRGPGIHAPGVLFDSSADRHR